MLRPPDPSPVVIPFVLAEGKNPSVGKSRPRPVLALRRERSRLAKSREHPDCRPMPSGAADSLDAENAMTRDKRPWAFSERNRSSSTSIALLARPSVPFHSSVDSSSLTLVSWFLESMNLSSACWSRNSRPAMMVRFVSRAEQTRSPNTAGVSFVPCISPTSTNRSSECAHNRSAPGIGEQRSCSAPLATSTTQDAIKIVNGLNIFRKHRVYNDPATHLRECPGGLSPFQPVLRPACGKFTRYSDPGRQSDDRYETREAVTRCSCRVQVADELPSRADDALNSP